MFGFYSLDLHIRIVVTFMLQCSTFIVDLKRARNFFTTYAQMFQKSISFISSAVLLSAAISLNVLE